MDLISSRIKVFLLLKRKSEKKNIVSLNRDTDICGFIGNKETAFPEKRKEFLLPRDLV